MCGALPRLFARVGWTAATISGTRQLASLSGRVDVRHAGGVRGREDRERVHVRQVEHDVDPVAPQQLPVAPSSGHRSRWRTNW